MREGVKHMTLTQGILVLLQHSLAASLRDRTYSVNIYNSKHTMFRLCSLYFFNTCTDTGLNLACAHHTSLRLSHSQQKECQMIMLHAISVSLSMKASRGMLLWESMQSKPFPAHKWHFVQCQSRRINDTMGPMFPATCLCTPLRVMLRCLHGQMRT